jgi:DNA-binding transcriptional ArsR family regulator
MARAPTTTDAFAAIAEPRRREILEILARGEVDGGGHDAGSGDDAGGRDVSWFVKELGWPQPQVSKHLGVLRAVGLVSVVRRGRHRVYRLNGEELRTVYDWVKMYERFWENQLSRVKDRAEQMAREAKKS